MVNLPLHIQLGGYTGSVTNLLVSKNVIRKTKLHFLIFFKIFIELASFLSID